MNCYLAGPIDQVSDHGSGWRNEVKEYFKDNKNILFFDPVAPYSFGSINRGMSDYIVKVNIEAMNHADLIVVRMMKDQVSIGTPTEMYHSLAVKKPMIICTDIESVYMTFFIARALEVVCSTEQLCTAVLNAEIQIRVAKDKAQASEEMKKKMDVFKVFGDELCRAQNY
jgi:nucleoside 2-deoxyribosyltransferase